MPVYRARTRSFPPFSPPASHMTIKIRVFVAIVESKLPVRVRVRVDSSPGFDVSLSPSVLPFILPKVHLVCPQGVHRQPSYYV